MKTLLHIIARLKRLDWPELGQLMLLALTAFILAVSLSFIDLASTANLLVKQGVLGIGFNYLMAGILFVPAGYVCLKLERRKGYGASVAMLCLFFVWIAGDVLSQRMALIGIENVMFSVKYITLFVANVAFWCLVKRMIRQSISSLRYLGVLAFELLGGLMGCWMAIKVGTEQIQWWGTFGLLITALSLKVLSILMPVSKETFIKKIGGVQTQKERLMMNVILMLSFAWMLSKLLSEYLVYENIVSHQEPVLETLSKIGMSIAVVTLISVSLLCRTKFLYTTIWGLLLGAVSVGVCGLGAWKQEGLIIYTAAVIFEVISRLYMKRYLSLLPRPLAVGTGVRLKQLRWCACVPLAFILTGSLLLSEQKETIVVWLISMAGVLIILFWLSSYMYGRYLIKICSLRIWRGGPLLLSYPPLKQMIKQGLSKPNPAESIYFLNILEEGHISNYKGQLMKLLSHPAITVRLAVLKKMNKWPLNKKEQNKIHQLMVQDECEEVRHMALALLIKSAIEENGTKAWKEYKHYLEEKEWQWGACIGFLSGKGAWLEKVIALVRKWADSPKIKDNLMALSVMNTCPKNEWTQCVNQLLNKQDTKITKQALLVAGKIKSPLLVNRLLPMLDEIRWREHVLEALSQYGKRAFPAIEKMLLNETVSLDRKKELILFLGRLPSGEGKQILLRSLFGANRLLRPAIIESLSDSEIVWIDKSRKRVLKKALSEAVSEWTQMHKMCVVAHNLEAQELIEVKALFQEAIKEEMYRTRMLILNQLALYVVMPLAQKAIQTLKENDLNKYAGAVSFLQDVLPKRIHKIVAPVLLYPTLNMPPKNLQEETPQTFLNSFILNPFRWSNKWMRALALYGWKKLGDREGMTAVMEGLKSPDWIVLEGALSALAKLEPDKNKVRELALNIPTHYLLQQDFESLLEEKNVGHN